MEGPGVDHVDGVGLVPVVAGRHLLAGLVELSHEVRFLNVRVVFVCGQPASTEQSKLGS